MTPKNLRKFHYGRLFRYIEVRLSQVERQAWRHFLNLSVTQGSVRDGVKLLNHWRTRLMESAPPPLDGLAHLDPPVRVLTQTRLYIYELVLCGNDPRPCHNQPSHQDIGTFRGSVQQWCVPLFFLTRAWLRVLEGDTAGAQADLDEAWQIAERGSMKLHLADVHLCRARLFDKVNPYPWGKDRQGNPCGPKNDLAEARKLIDECHYHRRDGELADAEEAAKGW